MYSIVVIHRISTLSYRGLMTAYHVLDKYIP